MSSVESDLPMPCHLDPDLLTLAVHLARRDVSRLRSPINVNQQQLISLLAQDGHTSPAQNTMSVTVGCDPDPAVVPEPRRSAAHAEIGARSTSTRDSGRIARPSRSLGPNQCAVVAGSVNALPARGDSPPTRDTDPWVPGRARPLHEPTEKQLQNARDSHLRQLQAKIARYSAAMAELRVAAKPKASSTSGSIPARPSAPLSRARGSSAGGRFYRSTGRRGPLSALVRHDVVPLCSKSRGARPTRCPHSAASRTPRSTMESSHFAHDSLSYSDDPQLVGEIEERMERQVNDLWEQTVRALRAHNPELVLLQPDNPVESITPLQYHESRPLSLSNNQEAQRAQTAPEAEMPRHVFPSSCSCPHEADCPPPDFETREILHELEQAEAEEAEICRRWAHLSLGRRDSPVVAAVGPNTPAGPIQQPRAPVPPAPAPREIGQRLIHREPESDGSPLHSPQFSSLQIACEKQTSQGLSTHVLQSDLPADRVPLCLPIELHRAILLNTIETKQLQDKWLKEQGLLSADGTPLVRVCEQISDELVDEVISAVADDLEREVSCLVDALVDGELHSEAPDSASLTGPTRTPLSRPESSTCASDSFGSAEPLSPRSVVSVSSVQSVPRSGSLPVNPAQVQPHSECVEEPSYTFQFDAVSDTSANTPDGSRSSATLLANHVLAESRQSLDSADTAENEGSTASFGP